MTDEDPAAPRGALLRSPVYWLAFAAGLGWTILLWTRAAPFASALDDEIGHYLIARDVWTHPELLLNAWGRLGTTASFVLPAAGGLGVARGAALGMSSVTVLVTTQLARLVGGRALALVPVLLWFQPWFHFYGYAVLTEVPFTLALVAGCWAALAGRERIASLLFGLLPLVRHEGIVVLGLWVVYLIARRRWRAIALAALPFIAYQAAFSLVLEKAPFAMYLHGGRRGIYGQGGWFHYVLPLARSIGPVVAVLAAIGLVVRRRDRRLLLLAAPFVALVLLETVIYRYGLFGSGGNADYLLPVAAFAAIAAALGADWLVAAARAHAARLLPRRSAAAAVAAATLLAAGTAAYALRTNPAHADQAARPMRAAVDYLDARHLDPGRATATHVWFWALSGAAIPKGDGIHSPWSRPPKPRRLPMRSIVVWDCFYSNRFGLKWRALTAAGFKRIAGFGGSRVVVLERTHARGRARARPPCRA